MKQFIAPEDPREIPPSWVCDLWDRLANIEAERVFKEAREQGKSVIEAEALGQQARDECWRRLKTVREQAVAEDVRLKESGA